jgi:hypothetical protein
MPEVPGRQVLVKAKELPEVPFVDRALGAECSQLFVRAVHIAEHGLVGQKGIVSGIVKISNAGNVAHVQFSS